MVITSPVSPILESVDPELSKQLTDASLGVLSSDNFPKMALFGLTFGISTVLGLIFWAINRTTKNTAHRISGTLCGIMVMISLVSLVKVVPLMSTPELSELNSKVVTASPLIFILILLTFPATLIAPYLGQKFLHNRSIQSLHTAATNIRWGRGLQALSLIHISEPTRPY